MQTPEDARLFRRFTELADRAAVSGKVVCSDFLNLHEQSLLSALPRSAVFTLFGGFDGAERQIACFGAIDTTQARAAACLSLLEAAPVNPKFADELTHRDFLGGVMHLGLRREMLGDILVHENRAYIFCKPQAAQVLENELTRVRRTSVRVTKAAALPDGAVLTLEPRETVIASERLDALVAAVFHLSRADAQKLIAAERVFVDSAAVLRPDFQPAPGQRISVRGGGRFRYDGVLRETKKGRLRAQVQLYV